MTFFSNKGWLGTGFAIVMFLILSVMITSMGTKIILSSNRSIDAAREKQAYWISTSGQSFIFQEQKKGQGIMDVVGGKVFFDDLCVVGQSSEVLSGGGLITLLSDDFTNDATFETDGTHIDDSSPCGGSGQRPQLNWNSVPTDAEKLVIIMSDADADTTDWAMYNIGSDVTSLAWAASAPTGATEMTNYDYTGPCPPIDGVSHRYVFKIYALNASIDDSPANIKALKTSMEGKIIACGQIVGRYERTS